MGRTSRTTCWILIWIGIIPFLLFWSPVARGEAGVWVTAVRDGRSGKVDADLVDALQQVLELRARQRFHWGTPSRQQCLSGCAIIRVTSVRVSAPRYVIDLRWRPGNRTRSVVLEAPSKTDVRSLADAIFLKCLALLDDAHDRVAAPVPPVQVARRIKKSLWRRFAVGLGPSLLVGLDRTFLTFGIETSLSIQIIGPVALRFSIGWQDLGRTETKALSYQYRAFPVTALAGARWWLGRWTLEAYGGMALLPVWIDFEEDTHSDSKDVALGAAIEARATFRVHRWIAIGFSVRPIYMTDDMRIQTDQGDTVFRLPSFVLSVLVDVQVLF